MRLLTKVWNIKKVTQQFGPTRADGSPRTDEFYEIDFGDPWNLNTELHFSRKVTKEEADEFKVGQELEVIIRPIEAV